MRHAGIVLAAGASSRMGRPKALLTLPDGAPLALDQARRLRAAGCEPVVIVLGCDAARIRAHLPGERIAVNRSWATGRFSSVKAGLRAAAGCGGFLFLPVDTAGVSPRTLKAILRCAERGRPPAVRPTHRGRDGKVLWLSCATAHELLALRGDIRLDEWVRARSARFPVRRPSVLSNLNTPADWSAFLRRIRSGRAVRHSIRCGWKGSLLQNRKTTVGVLDNRIPASHILSGVYSGRR